MPALTLGVEQPEAELMGRPPRTPYRAPLLGRCLATDLVPRNHSVAGCDRRLLLKIHSAHRGFDASTIHDPVYRQAITISQAAIVVSQVFVGFTVRTDRQSLFSIAIFTNRLQVAAGALGVAIVSVISYVPALQSIFNTAALIPTDWALVTFFGALAFVADEARTAWNRTRRPPTTASAV